MNSNGHLRAFSLLVAIPVVLTAQLVVHHDPVTLRHWPAPLYWQPAHATEGENFVITPAATASLPSGASALVFVAMTPCRVVDTRTTQGFSGAFGPPSLARETSRTFPVSSSTTCAIPKIAQAYSFNITVVPPGPLGYITAYPTGQPLPLASTVNSLQGFIVANAAIVAAGANGSVDVYSSDSTDMVIDINGFYALPSSLPLGGTAAAPAFTFGDTTTGLFSSASDTVSIATGGIERLTVTSDGDLQLLGSIRRGPDTLLLHTLPRGSSNMALGQLALGSISTGDDNTAIGHVALVGNTTGGSNTAVGARALAGNASGSLNTGVGIWTNINCTACAKNTAIGANALLGNLTGNSNTAVGNASMALQTSGNFNIALGAESGFNVTAGDNNIEIGTKGVLGDNAAIRIGDPAVHSSFFAAGVRNVTTKQNDAIPVMIDSNGQLGTVSSSIRYKEDIHDMNDASANIRRLHPVVFRYKKAFADGTKPIQYGLIAEEVEHVFPDLVVHDGTGHAETIQYQKLEVLLLNEFQKQQRTIEYQLQQIQNQAMALREQGERLTVLEDRIRHLSSPVDLGTR
jgi:hypothetical protein